MMQRSTQRLMFDSLWRSRMVWTYVGVCVILSWTTAALGVANAKVGIATSLISVLALGTMISLASTTRETRFLPVTSRDVWVVAWLLSTLGATLFVVTLQAVGLGIGAAAGYPQPQALSSLAFVALCGFVYGGGLLPVGPFIGYAIHAASERRPNGLWVALVILLSGIYLGGLVAPWLARDILPASFSELTWWSATVLVMGTIATFGSLAWTPQRFVGMPRTTTHASTPAPGTAPARTAPRSIDRGLDRLTGLKRVLLPILALTLAFLVAGAIGLTLYIWNFQTSRTLYESLAAWGLLPFSAAGLSPNVIVGNAMFAPFFALSGGWAWGEYTRRLRVLPLSTAETARLLLATTVMLWALVWLVLIGIHFFVLGFAPTTLRPELFIYLTGLSSLIEAASRARKKPGQPFSYAVIPVLALVGAAEGLSERSGVATMFWIHAGTGVATFLIAVVLTHRTLRRSTSSSGVYQPTTPSFGG